MTARTTETRTAEMKVGEVAQLAGITVRTLHHYDQLGLVSPSDRSPSGYRLYLANDIDRLQEVLFFRELGFALDQIKEMIEEPGYDRAGALAKQRRLVERKAERVLKMMDALDRAIEATRQGIDMDPKEKLEVFGDFDPDTYEQETKELWGDTEAYKESARRTSSYTKDDWIRLKEESNQIDQGLLALMAAGAEANSEEAMDLAEEHRQHISRWFYDCATSSHAGLGEMYIADVRFKENIDKAGEGLAEFLSAAIAANADR